jgi:hypothetical protein
MTETAHPKPIKYRRREQIMNEYETVMHDLWIAAVAAGETLLGFHDWIAEQERHNYR